MVLRVATYLIFLWLNVALGWTLLDGSIFYRGWFLFVLGIMMTLSLVSFTTTDPGRVKSDELCPTPTATEGGSQSAQQQYFTQFCSLCNNIKPERAHHCRICNRCVLRMDHHCHWVGRCVGAGNYKSYLLTLFYGCLSSGVMLYVLWRQSGRTLEASSGWKCVVELGGVIVNGLLLLSIFCSVLYLLIWHGYLVASNVTTIEYFKWKRSMRDPGQYALSPGASIRLTDYDRGLLLNMREVLGNESYLWCWPGFGEGWRGSRWWCCGASRKGVLVSGEGDADGEGEGVASSAGGWWSGKGTMEAKNAFFSIKPIPSGFATSVVELASTGTRAPSIVSAINPL